MTSIPQGSIDGIDSANVGKVVEEETHEGEQSDEEIGKAEPPSQIKKRTKPFIILVAACAALGGLIFGYDIAGAGGTFVMTGFEEHFNWKCSPDEVDCVPASQSEIDRDQGLINGLFGVGATFGAILAPWMADNYGRKACLYVAAIMFIFGAALQTSAPTMQVMWSGRVFAGMGIGGLSMAVPVYIGEVAPEHVRGQLATLWQLAITAGILIAAAANMGLQHWDEGWRISYGGNIVFAIILVIALFFMPESPRWLAGHGLDEKAREAMMTVRYEDEIESEIEELHMEAEEERKRGVASWSELLATTNKMRYRLLLGIALQSFQQLSGINAIMFYAPRILALFFGNSEAIAGTFVLNAINFVSTFITIYTVEIVGRVKLLVSGGIIMMIALVVNAIMSSLEQDKTVGYVVVLFAAIFIVGFAFSWGPVVWVVCAEMFPLRSRGKATGVTTMSNWAWTTVVGAVFPVASTASLSGCFGFFSVVIFIGTLVVYFYEAETAGRTIIEIDEEFENHKPALYRKKWN